MGLVNPPWSAVILFISKIVEFNTQKFNSFQNCIKYPVNVSILELYRLLVFNQRTLRYIVVFYLHFKLAIWHLKLTCDI
jgi:hypothetical protein